MQELEICIDLIWLLLLVSEAIGVDQPWRVWLLIDEQRFTGSCLDRCLIDRQPRFETPFNSVAGAGNGIRRGHEPL